MDLALVSHNVVQGDGQGRVNYELTRYLLNQGIQVTLVAENVADELLEQGAKWHPIQPSSLENTTALFKVWGFSQRADRILQRRRDDFDVVVGCGVTLSVPHDINVVHFAYGGWRRSPHHVFRTHPSPRSAYQWLFTVLNDRWERQTLSAANHIVAVSSMVKNELCASGIPENKIEVIVNGVDVDEFRPGPANRSHLDLPEDVPLGLFVGDICSRIKNPDGVLRALADVSGVHLAIAGSLEGSPLPGLARELGISHRVHFLGFQEDIASLMRVADFFTLPSRRDSCPLVLLEALASGLPALVSERVGTSHLVGDDAGVVVESPEDHEALVRGIEFLAHWPGRRDDLGANARAVAQDYGWERMGAQYHRLIQRYARNAPMPTT